MNLPITIMFSGYENFVSKLDDLHDHRGRPDWMGEIGFSDLKIKLLGSIVAISAIELLNSFVNVGNLDDRHLGWMVGTYVPFVVSSLPYAVSDRLQGKGR